MNLEEYYSKKKHTRKENKNYNKVMRKKYKGYLNTYHDVKITYRKHTVEKLTFADYKKLYEAEFRENLEKKGTDGFKTTASITRKTTLEMTDADKMRTLGDEAYYTKLENFKRNRDKYEAKLANGVPLTDAEYKVINYRLPKGEVPFEAIVQLVNYFERLGYEKTAFDSK